MKTLSSPNEDVVILFSAILIALPVVATLHLSNIATDPKATISFAFHAIQYIFTFTYHLKPPNTSKLAPNFLLSHWPAPFLAVLFLSYTIPQTLIIVIPVAISLLILSDRASIPYRRPLFAVLAGIHLIVTMVTPSVNHLYSVATSVLLHSFTMHDNNSTQAVAVDPEEMRARRIYMETLRALYRSPDYSDPREAAYRISRAVNSIFAQMTTTVAVSRSVDEPVHVVEAHGVTRCTESDAWVDSDWSVDSAVLWIRCNGVDPDYLRKSTRFPDMFEVDGLDSMQSHVESQRWSFKSFFKLHPHIYAAPPVWRGLEVHARPLPMPMRHCHVNAALSVSRRTPMGGVAVLTMTSHQHVAWNASHVIVLDRMARSMAVQCDRVTVNRLIADSCAAYLVGMREVDDRIQRVLAPACPSICRLLDFTSKLLSDCTDQQESAVQFKESLHESVQQLNTVVQTIQNVRLVAAVSRMTLTPGLPDAESRTLREVLAKLGLLSAAQGCDLMASFDSFVKADLATHHALRHISKLVSATQPQVEVDRVLDAVKVKQFMLSGPTYSFEPSISHNQTLIRGILPLWRHEPFFLRIRMRFKEPLNSTPNVLLANLCALSPSIDSDYNDSLFTLMSLLVFSAGGGVSRLRGQEVCFIEAIVPLEVEELTVESESDTSTFGYR
ncbi:hypothetical protein J8273_8816 [Carpediemonas membranifera]|uniref:Uncharacterized protein n=1 Tax=Carpediemonas membranifera TaxID=201153 RepID=A0A8J6AVV2_9EUKA|nr:hypothetical protein J8273_8816 [Carpediemonas membranifera]|eukprot:KAG9389523.1 hypothetical protein J8273_8816 [Carpediemonas membranifera]